MGRLPDLPGLTWRPWHAGDVDALVRHVRRIHEAEGLSQPPGPEMFRWLLGQEEFDPSSDGLVAVDDGGEIRGEAGTWAHITPAGARCFVWADTTPDHAGLRPHLVRWAEDRATVLLAAAPDGTDRVIRTSVEAHRAALAGVFLQAGFRAGRTFVTMRRSLDGLPVTGRAPDGIAVVPWSPGLDESAREASNASFADHWGSLPMSPKTWRGMYRESGTFRPDLSFLAIDGRRVVSLSLVAAEGTAEVEVHRVGTVRTHRRRGIAGHLVLRSLHAAAAAGGFERASLDVDESSGSGAVRLYADLGFEIADRSIQYVKPA
jgi:ribosomal protein S18 acetylase RimI-like enzyme